MRNDADKSIFRAMLSVSGIVVLAKVLGFVKQIIVANAFGATIQTDLISISEGLISNIDYILVQTLATAFVPTYVALKFSKSGDAKKFVSNVFKLLLLTASVIAGIVYLASPLISRLLAPTYSAELSASLSDYIKLFAPVLILIVALAIFNAVLKSNKSFVPGEMISVNQSLILIVLVFFIGPKTGPDTLVVAFYAYALINVVFLFVCAGKYCSIERGNPFKDPDIMKFLAMVAPLLLGYSVVFVNQQVDKIIVSGLGEGIVTAMGYAAVLSNFIGTFVGSLCGVLFTYITQNVVNGKNEDAADLTVRSSQQLITLLLPISVLTLTNANDIVKIVFGHGNFDDTAVGNCAYALIGYGCMFVPLVLRELFSRFQYAYGDSKQPMINSTIAIVFNIIFSIVLSIWFGVLGVTAATSISVLLCAVLNIRSSCKRNEFLKMKSFIKLVPQWLLGVCACIAVTFAGQMFLDGSHAIIRFVLITVISLGIYCLINRSMLMPLVSRLKRRNSK